MIYRKLVKISWKKNVQKILARTAGFEPVSSWLNKQDTKPTPLHQQCTIDLVVFFGLLTYIGRTEKNAIKNKTNTVPNPTTNPNPNPTIDEEKETNWNKLA